MIRHTVAFTLIHPVSSDRESDFLAAAAVLGTIPGVSRFEVLRQVGKKNSFRFGLSMEFETEESYRYYNAHSIHTKFVETYWIPEVQEFIEIDYEPLAINSP